MKKTFSPVPAALLLSFFLVAPSSAQTNAIQTNVVREISTRYLFVVDTSAAMRKRASAVETAVGNLLRSSMSAHLRRGDTVGIWTYGDTLGTGHFPLQQWTAESGELVASNAVAFLKAQRYEGESKFGAAVPALDRLIKESHRLYILLVSDGNEMISGTPFDMQINGAFRQEFANQQKARMPFVTVFVGHRGRLVNASVNLAPWPVTLPDFPPEPKIVEVPKPQPPPPPQTNVAPRRAVAPLVVIGKKSAADATNAPVSAGANPVSQPTNAVAPLIVEPEKKSPPLEPTVSPETKPSAAAPVPLAETNLAAPPALPATSRPQTISPTPPSLTPSRVAAAEKSADTASANHASGQSSSVAPLSPELNSKPAMPTRSETSATDTSTAASANSTTTNSPVAIGAVTAPEAFPRLIFNRWVLAGIGGVMVLLAGWFFVTRHRSRPAERVSLITSSMDREQK